MTKLYVHVEGFVILLKIPALLLVWDIIEDGWRNTKLNLEADPCINCEDDGSCKAQKTHTKCRRGYIPPIYENMEFPDEL